MRAALGRDLPNAHHSIVPTRDAMSDPGHGVRPGPRPPTGPGVLIVARDQTDLYECLQHAYADSETTTVLLDRRRGERRQITQPVAGERRRGERRALLSFAEDLRFQQYVLVRPHARRGRD